MTRIVESMTRIAVGSYVIRVWRNEDELRSSYDNQDLIKFCGDNSAMPIHDLAQAVSLLESVNAVEVLTGDGNGVLIYPNWP